MKLKALAAALLFGSTAMAQTAAPAAAPTFTFALKGFISMSAAYQTNSFFPTGGQQSLAAGNTLTSTTTARSRSTFARPASTSR